MKRRTLGHILQAAGQAMPQGPLETDPRRRDPDGEALLARRLAPHQIPSHWTPGPNPMGAGIEPMQPPNLLGAQTLTPDAVDELIETLSAMHRRNT